MPKRIKFAYFQFSFDKWQNLILFSVIVFYAIWLVFSIGKDPIQSGFSGDYLAFWSAGKIAEEKGYSYIYSLENLKSVQLTELEKIGLYRSADASSYSPLPVALFSIFVLPFQVLSRINLQLSYWIWTNINFLVLVAYLIFFVRRISPNNTEKRAEKKLILIMLVSYPVWMNFVEGQINVFLAICVGEFIRQAINQKPYLSGFWLGGLLLKPQLLILIMPVLLLLHEWKTIIGFMGTSFILLSSSLLLAGFAAMKAMLLLWTKFGAGMATNAPDMMINWRMIGLNLNLLLRTSLGWVITASGVGFTLFLVTLLIKAKPRFGSAEWVISMAAVFSATLAATWHSHYHMALVLIPFVIYAYQFDIISKKILFAWATSTSLIFLLFFVVTIFVLAITKFSLPGLEYLVATSGFALNLLVFHSFFQHLHQKPKLLESSTELSSLQ